MNSRQMLTAATGVVDCSARDRTDSMVPEKCGVAGAPALAEPEDTPVPFSTLATSASSI